MQPFGFTGPDWSIPGRTRLAAITAALAAQEIPFGDANGNLTIDPGFLYDTSKVQLKVFGDYTIGGQHVGGTVELYDSHVGGDTIVALGLSVGEFGDPTTGRGAQVGFHGLGTSGDIPGVLGAHYWVRENVRLYFATSNTGALQLLYGSDNQFYFSPFDQDQGTDVNDGLVDLGRYTTAGVLGAGYTRHLRFGTGWFKNGIKNGPTSSDAFVKMNGGVVAIRKGDDSGDASLTALGVTASSFVATTNVSTPAIQVAGLATAQYFSCPRQVGAYAVVAGTTIPNIYGTQELTAAAPTTITATPNITTATANDGQHVTFINTGANAITFKDNVNLANSKFKNGGTDYVLQPGTAMTVVFSTATGFWTKT